MDEAIETQLSRIYDEGCILLHTPDLRAMFRFYLRRMYAKGRDVAEMARANARDVAQGFMDMME